MTLTLLLAAPCVVVGMPGLGVRLKEEGIHQRCLTPPLLSSLSDRGGLSFLTLEIQVESCHLHESGLDHPNP